MLHFTEVRYADAWRKNDRFNQALPKILVRRADVLLDAYTDGEIDTATATKWLASNITDGAFPPPTSVLGGVEEYIDSLTDDDHGLHWPDLRQQQDAADATPEHGRTRGRLLKLIDAAGHAYTEQGAEDTMAAFAEVYMTLKEVGLRHWLFTADDPELEEGLGAEFHPYRHIAEGDLEAAGRKVAEPEGSR